MKYFLAFLLVLAMAFPAFAKNENKQKNLPPGLQKKYERTGELPPGWQKKLVKGEVLDIDLYKSAKPYTIKPGHYPMEPKAGTSILRIEDRVIRIMNDTRVILDVFGI